MNGNQSFYTDFNVTADTDNFIVETAVKWTNTTKRQLMGCNTSGAYFGITATGVYEAGKNSDGNVKASTTAFDHLQATFTSSSNTLYVNDTYAGKRDNYTRSGAMMIGDLISGFSCSCDLKYFKIYQDSELIYCLIPVQNSAGVAGMYDTVNYKFYASSTSTAFIAGPELGGGN